MRISVDQSVDLTPGNITSHVYVSEPYPDRGRSVLVRVYIEAIPRGGR